ncbi:DNA-3-methyladenine glycosylase I [Rossellomorea vietnamensis]|uniref:DNA-3-methyladenine glycosylase I n=1 Tax=Rossellomorea vietnamensis TaxID=218284 RepID=A0A5D4NUW6_9BACI|nr:DNA-3-methyladenine glycosylase I [Rossellomorea vietnamensis]
MIYSFMQAIGMVDDHVTCYPYHTFNKERKMEKWILTTQLIVRYALEKPTTSLRKNIMAQNGE